MINLDLLVGGKVDETDVHLGPLMRHLEPHHVT
jgi:hypothetical protein